MLSRSAVWFVLLVSAGCGTAPRPEVAVAPADTERITLHVANMAERLDLRCPD